MKYMVIIYGNKDLWQSFPPDVLAKGIAEVDAFNKKYMQNGELLAAYGLGDELTAKTVRVRDGVPAVTDGPFAEAKEQVVGYCIVDCESRDRAIEIALRWPDTRLWGLEVRPILSPDGVEM